MKQLEGIVIFTIFAVDYGRAMELLPITNLKDGRMIWKSRMST